MINYLRDTGEMESIIVKEAETGMIWDEQLFKAGTQTAYYFGLLLLTPAPLLLSPIITH